MHPNEKLITKFYQGFQNSDASTMTECYHADVSFSDPVFPALTGDRAKAMWTFLCQRKADPKDRWFENIRADDRTGSAHWEARYKFPLTGRPVHNKIDARFSFEDGKILTHVDTFDFWKWARMAFGPVGFFLGWTPFFKKLIQKKLNAALDEFIASQSKR